MATVTPNFNWPVPTSTDLVKDGATAIEALGDSIDASLVDLKGGTSGQVLSKNSNTDMDFTWVTTDDANAIQNSIVDAKGDLISATANDTPARLAVGNNGETLVADSSTSTGLRYQGNYAAGKNKIINGDFGIWQRGTSFTNTSGNGWNYYADRFQCYAYAGTLTVSRQTFTPGAAPVAGYEGSYFMRLNSTGTSTTFAANIEDVQTFAGQTVTISMWMKSASAQTITSNWAQVFGSGGSSAVTIYGGNFASITTSWARYSYTVAIPSISGKTIGTSSQLFFQFIGAINNNLDVWGVQIEAGNTATAFQTATGTIQGELSACQRYYWRTSNGSIGYYGIGYAELTNQLNVNFKYPVTMRTTPSIASSAAGTVAAYRQGTFVGSTTQVLINQGNNDQMLGYINTAASSLTQFSPYVLFGNNTASFVEFGAEL